MAIALLSPLDTLGDEGVFSAHMAQHLLLLLVVPVGLIAGLPSPVTNLARAAAAARPGQFVASLPVALLLSIGTIWVWHAPRLFDAALQNPLIHLLEHATFVGSALLYWWPVVRPADFPRPAPELALLLYLFGAAVACSLLGALVTLSGEPLYATTVTTTNAIARVGLTPLEDQQIGGVLMWGVGGLWYFGAASIIFGTWLARSAAADRSQS